MSFAHVVFKLRGIVHGGGYVEGQGEVCVGRAVLGFLDARWCGGRLCAWGPSLYRRVSVELIMVQ